MAAKKQQKPAKSEPKKGAKKPERPVTEGFSSEAQQSAPSAIMNQYMDNAALASMPAVLTKRQRGVVEYVKPNGRVRRATVVSIDPNGLAHLRLQDGTEVTVPRAKSALQTSAWRPEGDNAYE